MEMQYETEFLRPQLETAQTLDALLVLGGEGRDQSRSTHAHELYTRVDRKSPLHIVLTGGYTGLKRQPLNAPSESDQMRHYLLSLGVTDEDIRTESKSRDTLGNMVFAQPILKDIAATRIGIVTDPFHMERGVWSAKRVLGTGYRIRPLQTDKNGTAQTAMIERAVRYAHTFDLWLAGIPAGDTDAFHKYLREKHPSYTPDAPISAYKLGIILMRLVR